MNTLNKFAWQLGAHARITREHSIVWHRAYTKAEPATQSKWREDFVVNFVMGNLEIDETKARKIVGKKRAERGIEQERAVNAAGAMFRYHISRDGAKSRTEPAKKVRVAQHERDAFNRFLAACGDAARAKAVIKALTK